MGGESHLTMSQPAQVFLAAVLTAGVGMQMRWGLAIVSKLRGVISEGKKAE